MPTSDASADWDPTLYSRFRDLRLRPALDLLSALPPLPEGGEAVDLGCGTGAVAPALRARLQGRPLTGIDASAAMLAEAEATGLYEALRAADIAAWVAAPDPARPVLIFSNAALHWLPDHARLLPRLVRLLAAGGTLAVQMPRQFDGPSHALLRATSSRLFPDRFDFASYTPPVAPPEVYASILGGLGELTLWETEYFQPLAAVAEGHPVRHFTWSTAARPFLEGMTSEEAQRFCTAYDEALADAYPVDAQGACHFPFRRLFFTLQRGASDTP